MNKKFHDNFISSLNWQSFLIKDIFTKVQRGKRLKKEDHIDGDMPYVSSTSANNGVDTFIGNTGDVRIFKNCLSLANSGSVGTCFYEPFSFVASDHITSLHGDFSSEQYLFISTMLSRLSKKYNFNREINDNRISRERILLPINQDGSLCLDEIKKYISKIKKNKTYEYINYATNQLSKIEYKHIEQIQNKKWKDFFINDICFIESGCDIYDMKRIDGNTPYITSSAVNNGIKYFVGNTNGTLESNCISVNRNGSVGYSFYHKYKALYSNDCRKLRLKQRNNEYVSLFITNQIMKQKDKYNYSVKMGTGRLKKQKIMLPVNELGLPDYDYMEQYIKNMMYKKYQSYLDYKKG